MIPVTIIGGYLGAGKTTLVNHLLRHAEGRRIAVLVNEFGTLPIDADLIEAEGEDLIALAGGCICCAFGDDLLGAMSELAQRAPAPDHVVIEASGVALPGSIAVSIGLLEAFDLAGIVVLTDAETVQGMAQDDYLGDTVLRQLADADLVVATKTDLIAPAQVPTLCTWLQLNARRAGILTAVEGAVAPDVLLGPQDNTRAYRANATHQPGYVTEVLTCDAPVELEALRAALTDEQAGLLRAKGFVRGADAQSVLVQLVGRRLTLSEVAEAPHHSLVCIGLRGQMDLSRINNAINQGEPLHMS